MKSWHIKIGRNCKCAQLSLIRKLSRVLCNKLLAFCEPAESGVSLFLSACSGLDLLNTRPTGERERGRVSRREQ